MQLHGMANPQLIARRCSGQLLLVIVDVLNTKFRLTSEEGGLISSVIVCEIVKRFTMEGHHATMGNMESWGHFEAVTPRQLSIKALGFSLLNHTGFIRIFQLPLALENFFVAYISG